MGTLKIDGKLSVGLNNSDSTACGYGLHVHDLRNATITPNSFGDQNVNFYFDEEVNGDWKGIMHFKGWAGSYAAWQISAQASNSANNTNSLYFRTGIDNTWNNWHTLLDDYNYTSYTVTKTGGGASGTWGINISGNSNTVGGYQASSFLLKSGDTMTGNLTAPTYIATQKMTISSAGLVDLTAAGTTRLYADGIAISNPTTKNDDAWIRVTGTGEKDTVLEIATGDDGGGTADTGPEQIVVRQYGANGLAHQITLMDTSGNTSTSGTITASSFIGNLNGNASSATNADKLDGYHASSFALSGHTHNYLPWNIYSGATDFNTVTTTAFNSMCASDGANQPNLNHGLLITDFNVGTPIQIWYPDLSMAMYKRYRSSGTWSAWSNTWDINISGTAAAANSVAWGNVSGKPSSFTPASHTHSYLPISGGTMGGPLNFANGTWNILGDDVRFGDQNVAGAFVIEGLNGHTNLRFQQYGGSGVGTITFNGSSFAINHLLSVPWIAVTSYGPTLPTGSVIGQIFYKT